MSQVYMFKVFQMVQGGMVLLNGNAVNRLPSRPVPGLDLTLKMVGTFVVSFNEIDSHFMTWLRIHY